MENTPLKVGITGGIGTGKTLITKIFAVLGIPIYNADVRARWLMMHEATLIENIKSLFGKESYSKENQLNTAYLSTKVFNDQSKLTALNNLVHPQVAYDFNSWIDTKKTSAYILKEAALLFEADSYKSLNKIITVSAPDNIRIKRILERDSHRREKDVRLIMSKQLAEDEKIKKADYVIYNDNVKMVIPQVLDLHEQFLLIARHT